MTIENIQQLPIADYRVEVGQDEVTFLEVANGSEYTFVISDFSQIAVHASETGTNYVIGTTDISDLEANGYEEDNALENAATKIENGNIVVTSGDPASQDKTYDLGTYDVALKILEGTVTPYKKQKSTA